MNVYEKPTKKSAPFWPILLAAVPIWLMLTGVVATTFPDAVPKEYRLIGSLSVTVCILLAVYFLLDLFATKKHHKQLEVYEKAKAPYFEALNERINSILDGSASFEVTDIDQIYKPKRNETVIWAGPCIMQVKSTKAVGHSYSGVTTRIRLAKGVHYRAGTIAVRSQRVDVMKYEGQGAFVVTNQRVAFVNTKGDGTNWSKTWSTVLNWERFTNALTVQPTNGKTKHFFLFKSGIDPNSDTELVDVCMTLGYDEKMNG